MNVFTSRGYLTLAVALLCCGSVGAESILLPAGTPIYGELDEQVVSKKKKTAVGQIVRAHVWRNVVLDKQVVIRAGAAMVVRVSHVKSAKVAGVKGDLELEAVSARAVDGTEVLLDGGYDHSGKGRKALSITLFLLVAWPLIFIKGKNVVAEPGTIFDCSVQADSLVSVEGMQPIHVRLGDGKSLVVEPLYDEMDPEGKDKVLPLSLRAKGSEISAACVATINGEEVESIPLSLEAQEEDGDYTLVRGTIELKKLAKHFRKGINRFEVEVADARAEVILDVEL